ncbi:unnamed protein product, partial [Amoebophrya sp. A25]
VKFNYILVWNPSPALGEPRFMVFKALSMLFGNVHSVVVWVRISLLLRSSMR